MGTLRPKAVNSLVSDQDVQSVVPPLELVLLSQLSQRVLADKRRPAVSGPSCSLLDYSGATKPGI